MGLLPVRLSSIRPRSPAPPAQITPTLIPRNPPPWSVRSGGRPSSAPTGQFYPGWRWILAHGTDGVEHVDGVPGAAVSAAWDAFAVSVAAVIRLTTI